MNQILSMIKAVLYSVFTVLCDWCKTAHQNYLAREAQRKNLEEQLEIEKNQRRLRKELFEVFHTSKYIKLIQVKTLNNVRPASYEKQQEKILYYFTIDKEQSEKIASTICASICENMNCDIVSYSEYLVDNNFPDALQIMYPNLWHGVKVLNVTEQETNVKLTVVSNRPL